MHTKHLIPVTMLIILLTASSVWAVMPPQVYADKAQKGLEGIPDSFTGTCKSVDTKEQQPPPLQGGNIYLYPEKNQQVYVTITSDGGPITSYTISTPELEKAVLSTPEKIQYGFSTARVSP